MAMVGRGPPYGIHAVRAKPGRKAIRSVRKAVRASFDAVALRAQEKKLGGRDE